MARALLLAHYGVQSIAQRVYPPFEPEEQNEVRWWFDDLRGGYTDMVATVKSFGLRAPFDAAHPLRSRPWDAPVSEALELRRRDEVWAHRTEATHREAAILADQYDQYLGQRPLIVEALDWMQR